MTAVIVCGMPDEKRILTRTLKPGTLILSGTDKLNLPQLVPPDCTRLISMGVCGGLKPGLLVGESVLAQTVIDRVGDIRSSEPYWNSLALDAAAKHNVVLVGVPYYSSGLFDEADTVPQRTALLVRYQAWAIDDETRFVVAEAVRRKIPFNVARPLSDDASANLPLLATGKIMNPDGSPNLAYLASALGQDQGADSETVFKVAADYGRSLDALEQLAVALSYLIASDQ
jgi:hypothetical protein